MYFGFSNSIVARFENKRKEGRKISQLFELQFPSPVTLVTGLFS